MKTIYASDSLLSVFQVWNKWLDIQYNKDLNSYIVKMEESLAEFSSPGLKVPDVLVGCGIVGKITKRQPMLMQALFADLKAPAKPKEIIAKLCDIGRHKSATKLKFIEDPKRVSTALATGPSRKPKRHGQSIPGSRPGIIRCSGGKHNPKATTHDELTCWTIHPTTRRDHHTTPQLLKKTKEGDEEALNTTIVKPAFTYNTTSAGLTLSTVLDSGASNHMLNSLAYFKNTTPVHVSIVTGSGRLELIAVAHGTAQLQLASSKPLTLHEALYVPKLLRNLALLVQLIEHRVLISEKDGNFEVKLDNAEPFQVNRTKHILEIEGVCEGPPTNLSAIWL
ncbi:hypothetical protein PTTG_29488 [Puccinia triticina 1-1 BBBD Race 1]|uniref:Retrovirus-related Pol polyprotein from transposon TNT 1-94-like beta-barrel domain-containing protein n=1 Tax=Puccinia triticina (isolate 1-1 / race 1 (BBBD)) TaxID=630390 RepID=A0A180G3X3_PUCT1|nr:hypothetical protein PTTG_29488 [Puccinia triticina 1-1 BBBD Race 1]